MVGLKNNQKLLLNQVKEQISCQPVLFYRQEIEKGHGRIETCKYEIIDLLEMEKAKRWSRCQIRTAVKAVRERQVIKSDKKAKKRVIISAMKLAAMKK